MDMLFDKKTMIMAMGGLVLMAVTTVAVGVMVHRQTNKIRANMRSVSRGIYNFGSALQLLSGAAGAEDDCETCVAC